MSPKPGRYCALNGEEEVSALEYGMDFRQPRYRREVFLRFYGFHLKHRAHPGAVYYVMPYLAQRYGWDAEARLWFAYVNGNTQHPVTSYIITRQFPDIHRIDMGALRAWFTANYDALEFDTDRRYFKKHFLECVQNYRELLRGGSQADFFARHCVAGDERESFRRLWPFINRYYIYFGRLSCFSYAEYLRINNVPIDCDSLFLDDIGGSKSHRNGLCKVLGRDDLDWHDSNPAFDGRYTPELLAWLKDEGDKLLADARVRFAAEPFSSDVGFFTMESALCTYKSWHRPNRRYANVYNDMFHGRIKKSEVRWKEPFTVFWDARREFLPAYLRLEDTPRDPGVVPAKQNHYRLTGQPVMMHREWPAFRNDFNDRTDPL